jgi:hypothetical protein
MAVSAGEKGFELNPKTAKKAASSLHILVLCAPLFQVFYPVTTFVEKDIKRKIQGSTPPYSF